MSGDSGLEALSTNGFRGVTGSESRRIAVIGAGLAGAAVCARFAARGWQVDLIDAHPAPALGASGNHAASFHPLIARDDNRMVRLIRAGIDASLTQWKGLAGAGFMFSWAQCGALQLSRSGAKQNLADTLAGLGLDPDYARALDPHQASALAGIELSAGGVLFGAGGWVQPASLVRAQLASCGARLKVHYGKPVAQVRRTGKPGADGADGTDWELLDAGGRQIARAPVVVLAGGADPTLPQLFGQREWPVEAVSGQVTLIATQGAATSTPAPRLPVHGDGYILPGIDGQIVIGATYERTGSASIELGHQRNLARAQRMLATPLPAVASLHLSARVAARAVARDRLPVIGALPDADAVDTRAVLRAGARLAQLPRLRGAYAATAYGSRGLTWAALGAELLVSMLEGTPAPLPPQLIEAVDPARFALRAVRQSS